MLNINTRIGLPIIIENLARLAKHEETGSNNPRVTKNPVAASRLETVVLLLNNLENDKVWATMLHDHNELGG